MPLSALRVLCGEFLHAKVAELADALALGASLERGGGSTPPFRISLNRDRVRPYNRARLR